MLVRAGQRPRPSTEHAGCRSPWEGQRDLRPVEITAASGCRTPDLRPRGRVGHNASPGGTSRPKPHGIPDRTETPPPPHQRASDGVPSPL